MASKNTTQVLIGGKIYTMSGYESEEYLQRVAAYLNNKITQVKSAEGYTRMSQEMRSLLLNLNTADDYFKLKEKSDQLSENLSAKDKELYEIKHELISAQMKLENMTRDLESEQEQHREAIRELTGLRTRLEDLQAGLKAGSAQAGGGEEEGAAPAGGTPDEEKADAGEDVPAGEPSEDGDAVSDAGSGKEASAQEDGEKTLPRKQKYNRYYRK